MLLASSLVGFERLNLSAVHVLRHLISLPLLESEAKSFMRIILVVRLIFVVLDPDEVAVDSFWVKRECHKSVDSCSLRNDLERPGLGVVRKWCWLYLGNDAIYLLVLELDDFIVTANDLIALILGSFEELWEGKPLPCHLVASGCLARLLLGGREAYRSLAYTNWSSYTQSGVYLLTLSIVGSQLYRAIMSSISACLALSNRRDLDGCGEVSGFFIEIPDIWLASYFECRNICVSPFRYLHLGASPRLLMFVELQSSLQA